MVKMDLPTTQQSEVIQIPKAPQSGYTPNKQEYVVTHITMSDNTQLQHHWPWNPPQPIATERITMTQSEPTHQIAHMVIPEAMSFQVDHHTHTTHSTVEKQIRAQEKQK